MLIRSLIQALGWSLLAWHHKRAIKWFRNCSYLELSHIKLLSSLIQTKLKPGKVDLHFSWQFTTKTSRIQPFPKCFTNWKVCIQDTVSHVARQFSTRCRESEHKLITSPISLYIITYTDNVNWIGVALLISHQFTYMASSEHIYNYIST